MSRACLSLIVFFLSFYLHPLVVTADETITKDEVVKTPGVDEASADAGPGALSETEAKSQEQTNANVKAPDTEQAEDSSASQTQETSDSKQKVSEEKEAAVQIKETGGLGGDGGEAPDSEEDDDYDPYDEYPVQASEDFENIELTNNVIVGLNGKFREERILSLDPPYIQLLEEIFKKGFLWVNWQFSAELVVRNKPIRTVLMFCASNNTMNAADIKNCARCLNQNLEDITTREGQKIHVGCMKSKEDPSKSGCLFGKYPHGDLYVLKIKESVRMMQ